MNFKQYLLILFSIFLYTSCSMKPVPTEPENNLKATEAAPSVAPASESKVEKTKHTQKDVLSYFYELYPIGSGKPVGGLSFQEKDIMNGYLRVTGNMEGYYVYALFRGDKADWIIEQGTSCGPECEQRFQVYKFENGKLSQKKKFESLFPKKKMDAHVAKVIAKLPKGHTKEDLQSWITLPRTGTSIDILIVEQNPGHTSGEVNVYKAGKLDWNGSGFNFVATNPNEPSPIDISTVH